MFNKIQIRPIIVLVASAGLLFATQRVALGHSAPSDMAVVASTTSAVRFAESAEYPRSLAFRTVVEVAAIRGTPIDQVLNNVSRYDMIIAKALDEELLTLLKAAPYLQAIKMAYPTKPVLDHFLLRERNPMSTYPRTFAGHWLLLNGTTLTAPLPADRSSSVLDVADSSVLRVGEGTQITLLDAANQPDWGQVEQVKVVAIAGNKVTVERGAYGSEPLAFASGRARVSAHAWTEYNPTTGPLWRYNFCRESPRDSTGKRLSEALAGELAGFLSPGAVLAGLDGYQFDVASFWAGSSGQGTRRVDCNNDGLPDSGFTDNASSYGLGTVDFFAALRKLVGPDTMLVSEATGDWSSRDFASANGIENESFPDFHHGELFSSAYQRYQFWNQRAQKPNLSYLQVKETSEAFTKCADRDRGSNWKYRLPMGAALLGNGYFAYLPTDELGDGSCSYVHPEVRAVYAYLDEFEAGTPRQTHYLGKPLGDATRLNAAETAQNLLTNGSFETDLTGALLVTDGTSAATMKVDAGNPGAGKSSLQVTITKLDADPTDAKVRVRLSAFAVEKGKEYSLRLMVRANPGYGAVDPSFADMPRRVQVELRIAGVASSAEAEQDVLADAQWRTYWLSFVAGETDPKAALMVELGREAGDVWLDGLRLSQGASDVFYRKFERGIVLVNGSASEASYDLATLMPGMALRRLRSLQDSSVNSGECPGTVVTVPAHDALILQSQPAAATGTLLCLGGTLGWPVPAGTTQYQLQVIPANNDGPGINIIRNAEASFVVQPPSFGAGPYVMLPGMSYTWRVRTSTSPTGLDENSAGWTAWTTQTFRTPVRDSSGLRSMSPVEGGTVGAAPQSLQWANLDRDVFYYEVQVSKDKAFGENGPVAEVWLNLVHGGASTPANAWVTPGLTSNSTYYWRVRPRVQGDGTPVAWSTVWSFKTN